MTRFFSIIGFYSFSLFVAKSVSELQTALFDLEPHPWLPKVLALTSLFVTGLYVIATSNEDKIG